jgi:hypothetical protein
MGDLEVLAAAFVYAIQTIRLGVHAKKMSALELSTRVMVVSTACTFGWAGYDYATATLEGMRFSYHLAGSNFIRRFLILFRAVLHAALGAVFRRQ